MERRKLRCGGCAGELCFEVDGDSGSAIGDGQQCDVIDAFFFFGFVATEFNGVIFGYIPLNGFHVIPFFVDGYALFGNGGGGISGGVAGGFRKGDKGYEGVRNG